ncbi:MAG: chorismate lyase [Alcanivoracaceae bacterium]|nr:chorismate lyase [Alcanivoracaceae bacterium]
MPARLLNPALRWWPLPVIQAPAEVRDWLADGGSLTRRLQRFGTFRVVPQRQMIAAPRAEEAALLGLPGRQHALIREVSLYVNDQPVVFARSVLPLASLGGANRVLGHMARRSLGTELFRAPRAKRAQVWATQAVVPGGVEPCWGRQSLFLKRGQPLLVAEFFLPALWSDLL